MNSVLFVCTANICRSPMAMGILRHQTSLEEDLWRIESAGVWAREGNPAHANVELILQEMGVDISRHRSRQVTREMLKKFNLVLVMELGHKEGLRTAFPELANKVLMLSEIVEQRYDIVDPIGGTLADFRETAQELEHLLQEGMEMILQLAKNHSNMEDV